MSFVIRYFKGFLLQVQGIGRKNSIDYFRAFKQLLKYGNFICFFSNFNLP